MRVYQFKDLFGNFGTLSMLKSSIINNSVPNFILMSGTSGTGKSSSAEILSLALTCENRRNEEPCLECATCKMNLEALKGKGISSRVKKINLGQKNEKSDIDEMISEIFRLERTNGNTVFILEEVHSLDASKQTALLEEIDKLDDNVYVILCTTKKKMLLDELANRAINFRFSNLKSSDSRLLLEKICADYNVTFTDDKKDLILKKGRGTPRVIVELVKFLKSNNCSYDMLLDFLGEINPKLFNLLFRSTKDLKSYYANITDLVNDYPIDDLIYSMKVYLQDLQFLSKGVSTYHTNTSQEDKKFAFELGAQTIYKMLVILHELPYRCQEPDFVFALLKMGSVINGAQKANAVTQPNGSQTPNGDVTSQQVSQQVASQQTPNSHIANSGIFGKNAIQSHLESVNKRDIINNNSINESSKLTADRFKEILGGR